LIVYINFSKNKQLVPAEPGFENLVYSLAGKDTVRNGQVEILPVSACILKK
jgi:hypothetical protein